MAVGRESWYPLASSSLEPSARACAALFCAVVFFAARAQPVFGDGYGYPHLKEQWEFQMQLVSTGATNVVLLLGVFRSWQVGCPIDALVGFCSMMTSVVYHTLQTLEGNNPGVYGKAFFLGGTESDWHRADNIFAIACFTSFFSMPLQLVSPVWVTMSRMVPLSVAITTQCLRPWNFAYTLFPIVFFSVGFLVLIGASGMKPHLQRRECLYSGITFLLAVIFFFLGMDDENDYLRIKHGFWHIFIGLFVYYWTGACNPPHVVQARKRLLYATAHDATILLGEEKLRHGKTKTGEPQIAPNPATEAAVQMAKIA
ncbi:hypothetical protein BESB_059860 [Besnoitia besnoiti]|uniref:Transmembrane protein n=1 Tax=Besnoitia besnoiti TaxID=94643 RepID=A0A2A9MB37_BESBE|nr:hypothetical protein BESB_059860 [Besnoitia besnoiti]PFH35099.1 hypothetical protein BESB_059860 [Besnoitia besnoiti]